MGNLFQELKRRKVFRVAAVYAVVAWVLMQIAATVLPALNMPDWTVSFVTVLLMLGFLPTIIAAWAYEITPDGIKADKEIDHTQSTRETNSQPVNYVILGVVLLVAAVQVIDLVDSGERGRQTPASTISSSQLTGTTFRSNLNIPTSLPRLAAGYRTRLDLSPHGDRLYYLRFDVDDGVTDTTTWVLDLVKDETTILSDGGAGGAPVVSPEGDKILIWHPNRLRVMNSDGSSNRLIRDRSLPAGWYNNEEIMLLEEDGTLSFVSTSGAVLRNLADVNVPQMDISGFNFIERIPGSNVILFHVVGPNGLAVYTFDIDTQALTEVVENAYDPEYVNTGHILFMRENDLWAVPYELRSRITGAEVQVIESVDGGIAGSSHWASYTVSDTGRLAYLAGNSGMINLSPIVWTDLNGNSDAIPIQRSNFRHPIISPDGEKIALTAYGLAGDSDVWVYDLGRSTLGRRTFNGTSSRAIWSADSEELYYQTSPALRGDIWKVRADGTGQPELVMSGLARAQHEVAGERTLLTIEGPSNASHISSLRFSDGTWLKEVLLDSEFDLSAPSVSPDGRWLAYASNETGKPEVYVRPYPNVDDGRWQVSSQGGRDPVWSPSGDGLFFLNMGTSTVRRVSVNSDRDSNTFVNGSAEDVVRIQTNPSDDIGNYSVSVDGKRILHFSASLDGIEETPDQGFATFELVENWFTELQQLVPSTTQ